MSPDLPQLPKPRADNRDMRLPRLIEPGFPHHLVLRGNNRRRLFSAQWEYRHFLKLLEQATGEHEVELHGLALMKNHVHLVVTPPSAAATSSFVKSFAQRYAQRRNRLLKGSGKLFEQRFFSEPLTTDEALARTTAYVDLNPVNAGICGHASQSKWTTYCLHIGRAEDASIPASLWRPSPWYVGLGATPEARQAAYAAWVDEFHRAHAIVVRAKKDARAALEIRRPNRTRAT